MGERDQSARSGQVEAAVARARRRLSRISGRALLKRRGAWVLGLALVVAALRPVLSPLGDEAPLWEGALRSLLSGGLAWVLGMAVLVVVGRRRGPKHLGAARALDEAGGHPEVVASGWAFGETGEADPLVALARRRAEEAAERIDVVRAFPLPSLRPGRRTLALFAPAIALALVIGAYDPVRVAALLDPPTSLETEGAAVLAAAAARVADAAEREAEREARREREEGARRGRSPSEPRESMRDLADRARRAADAARRGDRERALSELGEVGRAGREESARERALSRTLSRLSESLDAQRPSSGARRGSNGEASESLRLLARRTREEAAREPSASAEEERQRTLERLSRAAEAMREEAERTGSEEASRAAEELSRAAEELSNGDRRAAAEALERAAQEAQEMERSREAAARQAEALARLLEATGLLERAVQLAMAGREGEGEGQAGMAMGEGEGEEGEGAAQGGASADEMAALRRALAERLAAMGESRDGRPAPGPGAHIADRGGEGRDGLEVDRSARARSYVGEGERATQAVRGLGQNGEPTHAYREVFPSYGAIAEEAITDESIPPLRRDAVRRYFEGIRPAAEGAEPGRSEAGDEQEGNEG